MYENESYDNSYDAQLIHRCIQIRMSFNLNERAKPEMQTDQCSTLRVYNWAPQQYFQHVKSPKSKT